MIQEALTSIGGGQFTDVPSVETLLPELRLARKLLSESDIEINKGGHYTGREYEDD